MSVTASTTTTTSAGSTCPSRQGPPVRLWWADPEEWDRLVDESGLEVEARYGWFDRRPFDETSREAVYVARRPV